MVVTRNYRNGANAPNHFTTASEQHIEDVRAPDNVIYDTTPGHGLTSISIDVKSDTDDVQAPEGEFEAVTAPA